MSMAMPPAPARSTSPAAETAALVAATRVLARRLAQPQTPASAAFLQRRLARLARGLVRVAEANDAAFLGLTALAGAQRDVPARTAFLALFTLGAARELTTSRRALVRLALTVLLADLPDPAGNDGAPPGRSRALPQTPGADPRFAPARAASAVVGLLGADPGALLVAAAAYDGAWLDGPRTLGPLDHGGLPPAVAARLLFAARALLDRIAPADGSVARSPLAALVEVGGLRTVDPAAFRCLVRALGVTPAGAIVELEGGEWAVVLAPNQAADPLDRPRLRLLTDAAGRAAAPPVEIDLAHPACHGYRIVRLVDPAAAATYVAAAFLAPK